MNAPSSPPQFTPPERLRTTNDNNLWYRHENNAIALVFVHGVLSNSRSCWLNEDKKGKPVYWPWLVGTDKRLPSMDIFLGGYYTAVHAGDYDVRSSATELFNALNVPDIDYNSKPLDKPQLIFVCHSTGGIVVRYML